MSMISELVRELREIATNWNPNIPINPVSVVLNKAADTIEVLSAKLADMEQTAADCGGWILCKNRLPETLEYMEFEPTPYMKRLEIAYMTDMVEYIIGYFDGYKWIDKRNRKIENVIAWKPFLKLTEPYHEP